MKKPLIKLFVLLLALLFNAYNVKSQTYEIDQYHNQTITDQCGGTFTGSKAITIPANIANGCLTSTTQYADNENFNTTICNNTGDSVFYNFSFFKLIPGDTLYVYKITTNGDSLMYKLTGSTAVPSSIGAQNECLKFVFISDASGHGGQGGGLFNCPEKTGWELALSCVKLPQSCNGNPPAGDFCSNAAPICDFSGYCGNTSGYYKADIPSGFCTGCSTLFDGSIENNSWLKFVASGPTASFEVSTSQCSSTGNGIQMGIYSSSAPCSGTWTLHSDIALTSPSQSLLNFTITANNLIVGNTYYIMIDGVGGNICNYEVKANEGIGSISAGNDTTILCGDTISLTGAGALLGSGSWTSNPADPSMVIINDSVIKIAPIITTDYIFTGGVGNPMCSGTGIDTVRVNVNPPTSDFIINPTTICAGDSTKISYTGNAGSNGVFVWDFDGGVANPGTGAGPHWVSWTNPGVHNVTLTVNQGNCSSNSANTITVLHDTICNITCSSTKIDKTQCGGSPCNYSGPTILINEVMLMPNSNDGCIYGTSTSGCEGEWIELFNPDACNAIDISCYYLGNNAYDGGTFSPDYYGGGFALPVGTIVPPLGFAVVRGQNATAVPSTLLVQNGGNTVEIVINNNTSRVCIDGGDRLWFPNLGGWFAFYDENGVPQDAITWKDPNNLNFNLTEYNTALANNPCLPNTSCAFSGTLASYNAIPNTNKTLINTGSTTQGQSYRRVPDGGSWSTNSSGNPTIGNCNSTCVTPPTVTCDGKATVTVTGGTGSFSYIWDNGCITASVNDLCEGTHYVTVTDINNGATCVSEVNILDPLPPSSDFTITTNVCIGENATAVPDENLPNATYTWNFDGGTSNSGASSISKDVNFPAEGNYTVSLSIVNNNCPSDTTEKDVNVYPKPTSDFIASRIEICTGDTALINYTGTASPAATYNWNFNGGTAVTGVGMGPHVVSWNNPALYTVSLYVSENGCPSDTTEIDINNLLCDVTVPNVFTPNGDGVNDNFVIINLEYFQNTKCLIYNRWGKKVYESDNYQNDWNGDDASDGVYYYILEFANDRLKTMTGSVTIIRNGK